jgi:hypothetical protein
MTQSSNIITAQISPKVRASFSGCALSDRKLFPNSSCILPISIMGRKEHEGKRFESTMTLINKSFQNCTLLIVDSLYRHTLKIDFPNNTAENLLEQAKDAGQAWLNRNSNALKILTIPHQILYWNHFLNNVEFSKHYITVSDLYEKDDDFRSSIRLSIEQYLSRYLKRTGVINSFDKEQGLSSCVDYLKEECAGMCLWVDGQYDFEVYPTGRSPALAMAYKMLIQPSYPNLLKPVSLRFKKK